RSPLDFGAHCWRRSFGFDNIKVRLNVLWMIDVAMVTFAVVFPHNLPIGLDRVVSIRRHLGANETVRVGHGNDGTSRSKIWRRVGLANEKKAGYLFDADGLKPQLRSIDAVVHAAAACQLACSSISPLMVRANNGTTDVARLFGKQHRPSMAANIVKCPSL